MCATPFVLITTIMQAAKYYNNSQYLMHTPGPVYTIPEDDEEETEAQYYSDSSKGKADAPQLSSKLI